MSDDLKPAVTDLITDLRGQGVEDSLGRFTLDREKAREKMRQFQLAEPHFYVLELVQAAVCKGATRIRFDIDADDMRMRFDGRPFTLEDLEHLYSSLFARQLSAENDARRQLALGVNAAMALNPGSQVGSYEITAPLGAGGIGEVYRATDFSSRV